MENATSDQLELVPPIEACTYTKCYCEENVWKICQHIKDTKHEQLPNCFSVFISNPKQAVPIWFQKASQSSEYPVVWDYHVIFIYQGTKSLVFDLDTKLDFPVPFNKYMADAIRLEDTLKPEYRRLFRIVPADVYLKTFSCDRSHMKKPDQTWMAPPPKYPPIQVDGIATNLKDFMSMDADSGPGKVMTVKEIVNTFGDEDIYRNLALLRTT